MAEDLGSLHQLVFFAVVAALVLVERTRLFRRDWAPTARRWPANIGLWLIGGVISAILLPIGIYGFSVAQPPGLMERLHVPFAVQVVVTFLFLDFWRYWEHRVLHRVPLLWRMHLVHHSDTHVDVTTSERHHPLELLFGTAVMLMLIFVLGLPVEALAAYLLVAEVVALYSHANVKSPAFLEALIVTPAVHAVHHSDAQPQTDSNYGTVLTVWDRLFGTYSDPHRVKIPNFGLQYFHLPADTRLSRVLLQPFLYRRNIEYPQRMPETALPSAPSMWSRGTLLATGIGLALVVAVMWPTLTGMVATWRNNESYQYAWLVLPMFGYMLLKLRKEGIIADPRPDASGIFVAALAALLWNAATLMNLDVGRQLALVLMVQGIAMSAFGWRVYWRLFPTFALLFLMIPSGDLLQPPLRWLTAKSIDLFAALANLPHSTDGFFITIAGRRYFVAEECSGLTYVTLALFLSYCFGLLLYRSFVKVALVALLGASLAIVSNVIRVNAIVFIDWMRGSQMDLSSHGTLQWITLLGVLVALLYLLSRAKVERPQELSASNRRSMAMQSWAPAAAGACAFVIAGVVASSSSSVAQPLATSLPRDISGWTLTSSQPKWSISPPVASIDAKYMRDGRELSLVIFESLTMDAKLAESRLAPAGGDVWREKEVRVERGCAASECIELRHAIWQRAHPKEIRHVYFAYGVGSYVTQSRLAMRVAQGWHRLTNDAVNARLIAFSAAEPLSGDDMAEIVNRLQNADEAAVTNG